MPNVGPMELAVVLIIALVILGPKKLPHLGRSLGQGMREFKQSISGAPDEQQAPQAAISSGAATDKLAERVEGEIVTQKKA